MQNQHKDIQRELDDLKQELEHFQKEKERVRAITGRIGGVPKFRTKFVNALFIVALIVFVIVSFFAGRDLRLLLIELATITLSIKIIYLIHTQTPVNHFKLWILPPSSGESTR